MHWIYAPRCTFNIHSKEQNSTCTCR